MVTSSIALNRIYIVPRLMFVILFLIFEMPFISNAAGIYDNNLVSASEKNEKLGNIKSNKLNAINEGVDKDVSEYDIELLSMVKRNIVMQKNQDKSVGYQQYYLMGGGRGNYFINNEEIDAYILLETEMIWKEIKSDLSYLNIILNKIDMSVSNFISEYLYENIDSNYVLITDINNVNRLKRERNFYENKSMIYNVSYLNDTNYKHQYNYKTSSGNGNELINSAYGSDNKKNGDEQNILSLVYLWEKYSDIIITVLSVAMLFLVISSLVGFLTRSN